MTILKDASSTAVYGSRGANGVIVITTKRGKVGKPVVTFSTSLGVQPTPEPMELMSPYEFVKYQQELNPSSFNTPAYFAYDAALGRNKTLEDYRNVEGINFQDHVLRTGSIQNHNLALRGGTEQTRYSISGSLFDQKGTIINTGMDRYSGRVTIDQTISKKIKAGITGNYSGYKQSGQVINQAATTANNPTAYVLARAWMYRPITPKVDQDLLGEVIDQDAINASDFRVNPFIDLQNQHQITKTNLLNGDAYLTYDIIKDLQFKTTAGLRRDAQLQERFYNTKTSQGGPSPNNNNGVNGSIRNIIRTSFSNENSLNYKKTFNNDHTITALGIFSINSFDRTDDGYSGRLLPNENLGIDGLDEGVSYNPISSASRNTMASYTTRLDYNYKSKYLLTGVFRADGSSKFVDHWGYFPGAAIAWNMQRKTSLLKFFRVYLPPSSGLPTAET